MSVPNTLNAQTLVQAREALTVTAQQRLELLAINHRQGKKIVDLEHEVQQLASNLAIARQELVDARQEIHTLRAQLPDVATLRAYGDLVEYLTASEPAQAHLRIAA